MEEVEVVVAHRQRATLRVGEVFLKIDAEPAHADVEVRAMAMAPVPTPPILWRRPPVLAIEAVRGEALGVLGEPSRASPAAWAAVGAAIRRLHDAPVPRWPGRNLDDIAAELARECAWLLDNGVLPAEVINRNREIAEAALRPWRSSFIHGDLQISHVFVDGDEVTGIIDWSEAAPGDAMFDLVDQAELKALARDLPAEEAHPLVSRGLLRRPHRRCDVVDDEGVPDAIPHDRLRRAMGHEEHRRLDHSAVRPLVVFDGLRPVRSAHDGTDPLADAVHDVLVLRGGGKVEHPVHSAVRIGQEPVESHRRVDEYDAHRASSAGGEPPDSPLSPYDHRPRSGEQCGACQRGARWRRARV